MENIESMNRKELQALAKAHGIKANLSNTDIIAKLRELFPAQTSEQNAADPVDEAEISVAAEEPSHEIASSGVLEVDQTEPQHIVTNEPAPTPVQQELKEPAVGDEIQANIDGAWVNAVIKRINKKSIRVCLEDGKSEHTMKFEEIRQRPASVEAETAVAMETETLEPTESIPVPEVPEGVAEETSQPIAPVKCDQPAADMPDVAEPTVTGTEAMDCDEVGADATSTMEIVPEAQEQITSAQEDPVVQLAVEAPPTPIAIAANDGWNSATKFSLPGGEWRESMEPAVTRKGKGRGKERRNAGRGTMERLAEDMKQEMLVEEMVVDATDGTAPAPAAAVVEQAAAEAAVVVCPVEEQEAEGEKVEEQVVHAPVKEEPAVVEAPTEPVAVPEEPAVVTAAAPLVEEIISAPADEAPVVVPAPVAALVAAVQTTAPSQAPAPAVPTQKTEGPRMNKAQAMRLDAIQKKLVVAEAAPPAPTAFTIAAKPASAAPTPAAAHLTQPARPKGFTPSHRSSICTSAPSTGLHGGNNAHRTKPLATPLGSAGPSPAVRPGRLSIQVSGTKRKVSESVERDRSSSAYTAPDFKRMHNKQFSTLKSIAECVDQDKTVSARMTTAMESALAPQRSTPAVASFKPLLSSTAEVTKPAANPFSKVINKPTTPGKSRQVTATPILQSSSSAAHGPSRAVTSASGTNGANGGSANIVKSRTVTSFLPSGSAPAPVASSFLNNENAGPSSANCRGNNVTSFLKSKDSGSSASMFKHRSVSITQGGKPVNHGATKQRLQMF